MRSRLLVVPCMASALCLLEASRLSSQGQLQAPTFKAATTYIWVDAHVVDGRGQFVKGLQKGDFRVFEDGEAQVVETVELVDLSDERADSTLAPSAQKVPDAPGLGRSLTPRAGGRVYYLVVDDLHVRPERTVVAR